MNHRVQNGLIYTVCDRLKLQSQEQNDERNMLDFKFLESCTLTIFVKFDAEDNKFRVDYIFATGDLHKSRAHSSLIILLKPSQNEFKVWHVDFVSPYRMFFMLISSAGKVAENHFGLSKYTFIWYFFCPICTSTFVKIEYGTGIGVINVDNFKHLWNQDFALSTTQATHRKACGSGMYHIAQAKLQRDRFT